MNDCSLREEARNRERDGECSHLLAVVRGCGPRALSDNYPRLPVTQPEAVGDATSTANRRVARFDAGRRKLASSRVTKCQTDIYREVEVQRGGKHPGSRT